MAATASSAHVSQLMGTRLAAPLPSRAVSGPAVLARPGPARVVARASEEQGLGRREAVISVASTAAAAAIAAALNVGPAAAVPAPSLPPSDDASIKLCDAECEGSLESIPLETTASGLQFRDIIKGKGPSPPVGFQVAADYVAMIPSGKVFDSSLEKKAPYIFRVGAGQLAHPPPCATAANAHLSPEKLVFVHESSSREVIPGLDEGILSMNVGGLRRLYIPGNLSFPKTLPAAPGRPRVGPSSPVIFDVKLLYIPGLEDDE